MSNTQNANYRRKPKMKKAEKEMLKLAARYAIPYCGAALLATLIVKLLGVF